MILGNTVTGNEDGIDIDPSFGNTVSGNNVNNNLDHGFNIENSGSMASPNTFTNNKANENGAGGFQIQSSDWNEFTGNKANDNGASGFILQGAQFNTFTSNTANGNGDDGWDIETRGLILISVPSIENKFITNRANNNAVDGFGLEPGSNDNEFTGNTADDNGQDGFGLESSFENRYEGNTATSNGQNGFNLDESNDNVFFCNIAINNMADGFHLVDSEENTLDGNTMESNDKGLVMNDASEDNTVINNNFISNGTIQIEDDLVSGDSNNINGNYYDNFDGFGEGCEDSDVDGVCDESTDNATEAVITGDAENADSEAITKPFICEGKEPEPPMNACLTTGGVQTSTFEQFSNIGVVIPGSMDLEIIGEPEVTPTKVYGLVRDSGGNLIASGDSEGGPFISQVDPNTGELLIPPLINTFVDTGEGTTASILITDLAVQPGTGVIYGITNSESEFNEQILWTVNPETGEVVGKGLLYPDVQGGLGGPGILYEPRGIGFGPDGKLFAIVDLKNESGQVMLEIEFDGDERKVMRTMDIDNDPIVDGFLVCPDGSFMYTGQEDSSSIGLIDPVTGELIETSSTTEVLGDLAFRPSAVKSSGSSGHEPPTIGKALDGVRQVVDGGMAIDGQTWTVTQPYHQEFELLQMLSSPHTISNVIHCDKGVEYCNYIAVGFMGLTDDFNNPVMTVSASKDHLGTWTLNWFDPNDYISDPGDAVPADIVFVPQIIDNKLLGTSFTIDFKNKDTGQLKMGIQVRDSYNGVRNFYFNEGVEFIDADAYPDLNTAYDEPIEVEPLCFGQNNPDRNSCAFAKIKDWATANAEETLRQMMNDKYQYDQ